MVDIEALPAIPASDLHCEILSPELCAQWSKDPLTIITNLWASLQLTWTFMLIFVHLLQIARATTTYESMRGNLQAGPIISAMATGSTSLEAANITSGSDGGTAGGGKKKKESCLGQWKKLLGLDTFFAVAFNGYRDSKNKDEVRRQKRQNPFTRGVLRNCQDFWGDGPVFGRKENGTALLGGQKVDYTSMYEVPRGGMSYRGGYQAVPGVDGEEV